MVNNLLIKNGLVFPVVASSARTSMGRGELLSRIGQAIENS